MVFFLWDSHMYEVSIGIGEEGVDHLENCGINTRRCLGTLPNPRNYEAIFSSELLCDFVEFSFRHCQFRKDDSIDVTDSERRFVK